jgi:hypothetical protein
MREALSASEKGGHAEPSKQPAGEYLAAWLGGLRLAPSTVASYRKNVRLHIAPHIGAEPLAGRPLSGSTRSTGRWGRTAGPTTRRARACPPRTVRLPASPR